VDLETYFADESPRFSRPFATVARVRWQFDGDPQLVGRLQLVRDVESPEPGAPPCFPEHLAV
jgi:hypothetical protein